MREERQSNVSECQWHSEKDKLKKESAVFCGFVVLFASWHEEVPVQVNELFLDSHMGTGSN